MCPHCGEAMVIFEFEGIEIDHCMECSGTWLDSGELELLGELEGASQGKLTEALSSAKTDTRSNLRCPRCNRKMDTIHIQDEKAIELERCHVGHGLWFDKGELMDLIQTYDDGEEGMIAHFFANLYKNEFKTTQ